MISKSAVETFLQAERNDFSWIKEAPREELETIIKETYPNFSIKAQMFTHQLATFYLCAQFDGFLIFLDMGLGKEQPISSKILTPTGWKTMGEMKVGMEICHPTLGTSIVMGVYPQGYKDVYKVTFTDGSSTECGEEHLWTVRTPGMKWKGYGYRTWPLSRIKERIRDTSNNLVHFIPIAEPVTFQSERLEPFVIHPYALGCLIGDGGLSGNGICLTKGDKELFTLVEEYFPNTLKFSTMEGITQRIKRASRKVKQNSWWDEIRRLDLNTKSNAKHLPSEYIFTSIENRIALLQGLMDTDGHVFPDGSSVEWSTSSEQLCTDFVFLVQSLGGTAHAKIKVVNGKSYWVVKLLLPNTFPLFRLTRKKLRWEQRQGKYQPRRGIKSVEFIGRKRCQCIRVSNPDGLYITDDCIVTHNSLIALALIQLRKNCLKQIKKTLVVVPNVVNVENWIQETHKFTNLKPIALVGTKAERTRALKQKGDIYILNYDGLKVMMTELEPVKGKDKRKRIIQKYMARDFANQFDMLVLDETHHVKHTTSLNYKLCEILSNHCAYRIGMTGTPMGRDPIGLWSQFHVIDQGETLGTSKTMFLQALFKQKTNYFGGVDFYLPKKNEAVLHRMMLHRSIRYADSECQDLPPITNTTFTFQLPGETRKYYKQLINDAIHQDVAENEKRQNIYIKTRQLCSGFMYEGEAKERIVIHFNGNPKLEAVDELIDDLPNQSKMVIFHIFNQSGLELCDLLKRKKIKHAIIGSSSKNKNVDEYKKFLSDPTVTILVLNIMSGGEGLNLQIANYAVMYEPVDRPDVFRQVMKRIHRTGQLKRCYMYQFVTKNTVEEKIMGFLAEGKCLFDALVDGRLSLESLLGE